MFKSRTEKLLLLASNNEETKATESKSVSVRPIIDQPSTIGLIDVDNIFESKEESQNFTNNTSASTVQIGPIIDCLPVTELTELKPVSLVSVLPSSSRPNVFDIFESEEDSPNVSNNISASTSQLIDDFLAEDLLLTADNVFTIAQIPVDMVQIKVMILPHPTFVIRGLLVSTVIWFFQTKKMFVIT